MVKDGNDSDDSDLGAFSFLTHKHLVVEDEENEAALGAIGAEQPAKLVLAVVVGASLRVAHKAIPRQLGRMQQHTPP